MKILFIMLEFNHKIWITKSIMNTHFFYVLLRLQPILSSDSVKIPTTLLLIYIILFTGCLGKYKVSKCGVGIFFEIGTLLSYYLHL